MVSLMAQQCIVPTITFTAFGAQKRLLFRVRTHVSFQMLCFGERSGAEMTMAFLPHPVRALLLYSRTGRRHHILAYHKAAVDRFESSLSARQDCQSLEIDGAGWVWLGERGEMWGAFAGILIL